MRQQHDMVEQLHTLSHQAPIVLQEPHPIIPKGRPRLTSNHRDNDTSTRRDPSGFEYVDPPVNGKRLETCKACGMVGHRRNNARLCPKFQST
ncbi:hypothetical protein DFH28DRAFT_528656 [Melampsora americana]|nr:hypothetical protein DFH28DRAFT_528656 [Melampsora americana]